MDRLFEYPITRPFPYGRVFHSVGALLCTVVLAVIVIWAAATAGYETVSIVSPDYNTTQKLWYDRFIPHQLVSRSTNSTSLCAGATSLIPGASFGTTNNLFSYKIGAFWNGTGNTTTTTGAVEYAGTSLDLCTPGNILINVDILRNTVDVMALIYCYDVWPIAASTHYRYGKDPVMGMILTGATGSTDNSLWSNVNSTSSIIYDKLDNFANDLLGTGKLAYQQSSGASPVLYSIMLQSTEICPIAYIGSSCPAAVGNAKPELVSLQAMDTFANGTQRQYLQYDALEQNPDYIVPTQNLAQAVWSATIYDLGSTDQVTNNIFTSRSALLSIIQPVNRNATTPGLLGSSLTGAVAVRGETRLPISPNGSAVVRTTYLCRIKVLKNAAGFLVAVLGLSGSLFTSFLAVATLLLVFNLRRRSKGAMACTGHAGQLVPLERPGQTDPAGVRILTDLDTKDDVAESGHVYWPRPYPYEDLRPRSR